MSIVVSVVKGDLHCVSIAMSVVKGDLHRVSSNMLRVMYTVCLVTRLLRVVYTECPVTCPCGEMCSNQRIQRREWLSRCLEKFLTDDRGFGVRTTQAIGAGTLENGH